jgi:hypothetical protein
MSGRDDFIDSLQYDDDGDVLWPDEATERRRYAEGLFGAKVIDSVEEVADEMLSRVDGRWPTPGSMNYEEEAKVAQVFASMSPEQRSAVEELVKKTARLCGYSIFLGLEHFGSGSVQIFVHPINRGADGGPAVRVDAGEWHQAYLSWEEQFQ